MNKQQRKLKKIKKRERKSKEIIAKRKEQLRIDRENSSKEDAGFDKLKNPQKTSTIRYDKNNPRPVSSKRKRELLKKVEGNKKLLDFLEKALAEEAQKNGESEESLEKRFQKILEEATKNQEPMKMSSELVKNHNPAMMINNNITSK